MKAGDRVYIAWGPVGWHQSGIVSHITNNNSFFHLSCDDGTARGFRGKYLSLIDDKPTDYPFLQVDGIQEWFAGIRPWTNEEIDKLGRGLSDD